jgi:hypothetical protein
MVKSTNPSTEKWKQFYENLWTNNETVAKIQILLYRNSFKILIKHQAQME